MAFVTSVCVVVMINNCYYCQFLLSLFPWSHPFVVRDTLVIILVNYIIINVMNSTKYAILWNPTSHGQLFGYLLEYMEIDP